MNMPNKLDALDAEIELAKQHAFNSLAGYKFMMFGYWAGVWVHLNRLRSEPLANPFRDLVKLARQKSTSVELGRRLSRRENKTLARACDIAANCIDINNPFLKKRLREAAETFQ